MWLLFSFVRPLATLVRFRHLITLVRYPDKRAVNIVKVHIESLNYN